MEIIRANAMDVQNITTGEKRTILAIKGKDGKDGIDGGVSDVKIKDTSLIDENHVANIPISNENTAGVIMTDNSSGGYSTGLMVVNDRLLLRTANNTNIDARGIRQNIDASNLDYAVEASMGDGKAPAWSEQHQANARTRMGAASATDLTNATSYAAIAERLYNNTTTLTDEQKLKIETWLGLSENYLTTYNETPYQVTGDYNPAHKKYVDTGLATRLEIDMTNIDADGIAAVKRLANNSDIPELTTTDKTVIGAINEINSKGAGFVYESLGIVYPWSYNVTNQYVKASTNENLTLREAGIRPFTEENINRDFLFEMEVPDRPAGPSRSIVSGGFRGDNNLYFNLYYGDYAGGNVYFDMKDATGTKSRLANFNEYNNTKILKITFTRKSGKYNLVVTADGVKVAEARDIELNSTDYSNGQICIGGTFYSEGRYDNNTILGMTVNYARFRYES